MKSISNETLLLILCLAVMITGMGFAGTEDMADEQRAYDDYCSRVADNVHTDYDNLC